MTAAVSLERVPPEGKPALWRLLQLYLYDFTEFEPDEVRMDEQGTFPYRYLDEYWAPAEGEERHAYFIRAEGQLAGFVLVRRVNGVNVLSEFFVVRACRRGGVGSEAARLVFALHPGRWLVHEVARNLPAQAFWRRVIGEVTGGAFEEEREADGALTQRFEVG